jgi:hypothetical protein
VVDAICEASGGLPFAVVELSRDLTADRSALLPSGLPEAAMRALAAAAVLGSTFDTDEFAGVSGLSDEVAYAVLDQAVERHVLQRTSAGVRLPARAHP